MTVADQRTAFLADELLALLREDRGDPTLDFDGPPTRLTGGFWAELLSFRLASHGPSPVADGWDRALVARVMPEPVIAAKEVAFQSEAARQGFPTPAVHLHRGPGDGVDGRALLVMDLAGGAPLLAGLDGLRALGQVGTLARRLPQVLAEALAHLHRLAPEPVERRLAEAGLERPDLTAMLGYLADAAAALGQGPLADAAAWLAAHRPPAEREVLCHGDLHPFNVLVDDHGSWTVLDWSAAVLAPAAYDLGFTSLVLAEPPLVVPAPLRPVVRRAGRALSRRFVRAYERRTGVPVDPASLEWHQALVCVRALAEVATWSTGGTLAERGGHPWVIAGAAMASRLRKLTGEPVTPAAPSPA